MTAPQITATVPNVYEPVPQRTQGQSNFDENSDMFLASLPPVPTAINLVALQMNAVANYLAAQIELVENDAASAALSAELAENFAERVGSAVPGFAGEYSAREWAGGSFVPAGSSLRWATLTGGAVAGGEFSSKEYAVGTFLAPGSARSWATLTGTVVSGGEYSAKEYAQGVTVATGSAKRWASLTGGPVSAGEYSAKEWAVGTPGVAGSSQSWAAASALSASSAGTSATSASASAISSGISSSNSLANANAAGASAASAASSFAGTLASAGLSGAKAYASYALAIADFSNQTNNQSIFVVSDETRGGQGAYYRASGTPVTSLVFLRLHEYYPSPFAYIASDSVQNMITKLLVYVGAIPQNPPVLSLNFSQNVFLGEV